jgi:hypothetical protein
LKFKWSSWLQVGVVLANVAVMPVHGLDILLLHCQTMSMSALQWVVKAMG